jgi:hypothetical protein
MFPTFEISRKPGLNLMYLATVKLITEQAFIQIVSTSP